DAPEDGKPQAEALPSGTGLRAAKEGVEDTLAVLARDPGPPVLHHDGAPPGSVEHVHPDALARRSELERVREQIADRRREKRRMAAHHDLVLRRHLEVPATLPLRFAEFAIQIPDQIAEIDRLAQLSARLRFGIRSPK